MDALVKLGVSVQRFRNVDLFEKGGYMLDAGLRKLERGSSDSNLVHFPALLDSL